MKLSTDRILTTHTGALHRPSGLEELYRKKFANEPCDEAELERALRAGVTQIVRRQAESGLDVIDDGEYSKLSFWAYAKNRIRGRSAGRGSTASQYDALALQLPVCQFQLMSAWRSVQHNSSKLK